MDRTHPRTPRRLLAALTTLGLTASLLSFGAVAASAAECTGPTVAVIGADEPQWRADVLAKLTATCLFGQVDEIDGGSGTPTLESLSAYQAVLVYSNYSFADNAAMGDVLADYVDGGGRVVVGVFAFWTSDQGLGMGGRLSTGGYLPFTQGHQTAGQQLQLQADLPDSPYLANVNSFDGGLGSWHNVVGLASGATQIAHWNDAGSTPLVAVKGDVVGLNFYPPSSDAREDFWDASTDGDVLMANALLGGGVGPVRRDLQVTVGAGLESQSKAIAPGDPATFVFTITNDGDARDAFTALGETHDDIVVRYLSGRTDITAAVVEGTYRTQRRVPGRGVKIKLLVRTRVDTPTDGTYDLGFVGTSVGNPGVSDDALARVVV